MRNATPQGITAATLSNTTTISFINGAATILGDGTVDGQLKIIVATGVGTTTDVDFTDSRGAIATATMQTVGETLTCLWNNTDSKWDILSYGNGATGNNIAGAPQGTMDIS